MAPMRASRTVIVIENLPGRKEQRNTKTKIGSMASFTPR